MSEYIKHYGVKGMKWGIRKDSKKSSKKKHKNFVKNYYKSNIKAWKDNIKKIKNEGLLKYYKDSIKDLKKSILINSSLQNQHTTNMINNHIIMQRQQDVMNLNNISNQMTQISISQLNNAALNASHMNTMNFYTWQHMY